MADLSGAAAPGAAFTGAQAAKSYFTGANLEGCDFGKALHVSPFMGMDHGYEGSMTAPAQTGSVQISSRREGRVAFDATLALRRRELTRASFAKLSVIKVPALT